MKTIVPFYVKLLLFLYSLIILTIVNFSNVCYGAAEIFNKERWLIIGVAAILVEVLNQFTFHTANKKKNLIYLRGFLFWTIFTITIGYYIFLANRVGFTTPDTTLRWNDILVRIFVVVVSSAYLTFYSFCTNVRFLFLFGKYRKKKG